MGLYDKIIWDSLVILLGNEYGAAGLMGNLEAESGLNPDIVQGDVPRSDFSVEYTRKVSTGEISEYDFVHNGPNGGGYGLAQWTYYTRKQGLYDLFKQGGYSSIGDCGLAIAYLWIELNSLFPGVLATLQTATSVREASDKVLHDFESPADQSEAVEVKRASMGQYWYDLYHGTDPGETPDVPDVPDVPDPPKQKKKMPLLLMLAATRRRV